MTRRLVTAERTSQLLGAMRERGLVRLLRRFEDTPLNGYVIDVGPGFFLFAIVSDGCWFEGFECLRLPDIQDVRPHPYAEFEETALARRGESLPERPPIDVSSIEEVLTSAGAAFPLVTVHCEDEDPGACWIGRVLEVRDGVLTLLEILPGAVWDDEPSSFQLAEITRVTVGQDYEDALYLVGGEPGEQRR